jgi:hypothetical protein
MKHLYAKTFPSCRLLPFMIRPGNIPCTPRVKTGFDHEDKLRRKIMHLYFSAATLFALIFGTALPAAAQDHETDVGEVETDATETDELRQSGWNQWICVAHAPGYYRPYVGVSYFFREGSGEGQEARRIAQLSAIRQCEFSTRRPCRSDVMRDCRVQRY